MLGGSACYRTTSFAGCLRHLAWSLDGEKDPIASAAFCFAAPLLDLRLSPRSSRSLRSGCVPYVMHGRANPRDLDADFPVASRSVPPDVSARPPLLGFPKTPLHRSESGSPQPRRAVSSASFGERSPPLPRAVLVVSHHLDGFILLDRAGLFHPAPDPGVHLVSPGRETWIPAVRSCPSKPSLRRQRRVRRESVLVGQRHGPAIAGASFTACLALSPFLPGTWEDGFPSLLTWFPRSTSGAGAPGPCSIVGPVAPPTVASRRCPVLPWA